MIGLEQIARFLEEQLKGEDFKDSSHNGIQIANTRGVSKICCGVDASMSFFQEAAIRKSDLLICHHGLSWDHSLARIAGTVFDKVSFLIKRDIALYACHLPLDAHPKFGNNAIICKLLGLKIVESFGAHGGKKVGFIGEFPRRIEYTNFKELVSKEISGNIKTMDFGPQKIRSVAVISGAASGDIEEAGKMGADVFLSGEPSLQAYSLAQEYGINAIFAGHYATERFGVCALGKLLSRKFKIPWEFVDMRIPY